MKPTSAPEKKYDGNGKVINWSQLWPEAKELECLVVNGLVDGTKSTREVYEASGGVCECH
jgi:hypothetical protein